VVVTAQTENDMIAAVTFARKQRLAVAVQATGHGVSVPANGGVLINTSQMRSVHIDAGKASATVSAGAQWCDVLPKAHEAGLAALSGSSTGVGVMGYTLGGGSGWLGRKYGFAADSVSAARLITGEGRVLEISADQEPELFWAIRGGTSNFGVVSSLRFKLYPVPSLYGGGIYWPMERALEVSERYREWVTSVPEELTSRLAFVQMPPLPQIPERLRGQWLVAVQGAFAGAEAEGAKLFEPLRKIGGAVEDAVNMMPYTVVDSIARDPLAPSAALVHTDHLEQISPSMIGYLLESVTVPRSQIVSIEMRHQGGALARKPMVGSAVGQRPSGFWLNAIAAVMPPGGQAGAASALNSLRAGIRRWTTGTVQLNGIDTFSADRVRDAYQQETWGRLRKVKEKYDPDNLFRLNRNVPPGSKA
jgi:FAD/FMN-containing dehydrogenase